MPDLRDENFKKKNRRLNLKKRQKSLWFSFVLLVGCIVVLVASFAYGTVLYASGYTYSGSDNRVALAMIEISEGVYPWNYKEFIPGDFDLCVLGEEDFTNEEDSLSDNVMDVLEDSELDIVSDNKMHVSANRDKYKKIVAEKKREFITVDDSYFDDAVFIGDSRMAGIAYYANMDNATYYAKVAMTVFKLMDGSLSTDVDVKSVREGLTNNQFRKVYIMVGINELGTADDKAYINAYRDVITEIKSLQPNALVYVQAILHVTSNRAKNDKYVNNLNINKRNKALKQLAIEEDCVYLDVNPIYDDSNGDLDKQYTADDVHLMAKYYGPWHEFYLTHAVEPDPMIEVSENDISENDASENDASENAASENDASENDASENGTSGNDALENGTSENDIINNSSSQNEVGSDDCSNPENEDFAPHEGEEY